jgi:hypothetical protein
MNVGEMNMAKNAKTEKTEKKEYSVDFEEYAVRGADGTVDQDATVARFAGQLATFAEQDRTVAQQVIAAVRMVFAEQTTGARLSMPTVQFLAMQHLELTDNRQVPALQAKIGSVVRTSPEFHVGRGKGGGVCLTCDMPPAEEK